MPAVGSHVNPAEPDDGAPAQPPSPAPSPAPSATAPADSALASVVPLPRRPRPPRYDIAEAVLLDKVGQPSVDEVRLPATARSASAARRLTLAVLGLWRMREQLGDVAELLVSELVGNSSRHTGARSFGLRVTRQRDRVRIEVRDPSRALPCLIDAGPDSEGGRGLYLVDALSDRWGVDLLPCGKGVWFELRKPAA